MKQYKLHAFRAPCPTRDSSYFGLFTTIRAMGLCLCRKGLFAEFLNLGMMLYFDPTHWPDFRIDFQVGNRENSDMGPSCKL